MSTLKTVRLSECCEIVSDATPSTSVDDFWGGDICWATPKDLSELDGHYISDTLRKLTQAGLQSCAATVLPPNSVLFSSRAPIGHVAVNTVPMATNQGFKSFIPKTGMTDAKFLYHWLRANRPYLESLGNGATFKEVSKSTVSRIEIPLPSLNEQRRIAAILDRADALRVKRGEALTQLDSLAQSIFIEMFGDPITNPKGWKKEKMGNLLRIRRGGSPRPIDQFLGGTINWIKIGDATSGDDIYISNCADKIIEAGLKKTVFLKAGSLIFANCGVSLGFARILKIDGCIHDGWLSMEEIPEEKLNKIFLLKALNAVTTRFRKMAPDGTQPNLNTNLMKNFEIILPPIELQRQFASRLEALEKLKIVSNKALADFDTLFASLQHRAFRGEL